MTSARRHPRHQETIGAALRNLKGRFFVGRQEECQVFAGCLAGEAEEQQILNVYGPGGVGKSMLLDAFRRLAEDAGALHLYLDARDFPPSPEGFMDKLAQALGLPGGRGRPALGECLRILHEASARQPVALTIDTYEEMGVLDCWLREAFLAQLPHRAVVIVAGRVPLRGLWQESPAWRQLVQPLSLAPFDLDLTREYLALHGVEDEPLVRGTWDFTRGNPLALSLAAALVGREGPAALAQAPDRPEVVSTLTGRWLREVPDDRLRALLEAAATVRRFDQDLLAQLTRSAVAPGDFDRLTALSFVRPGPAGWTLHDLVRATISRELRWRSPAAFRAMRQQALGYYARLATLPGSEPERVAALEEFLCLLGDGMICAFIDAYYQSDAGLHVVPATAADLPALQAYVDDCRAGADRFYCRIALVDRESGSLFRHQVSAHHLRREWELINLPELLALGPGVVRMLKDADGNLVGLSVVIPVNAQTLDYLEAQPVTGHYFRRLDPEERAGYAVPQSRTGAWFFRALDLSDPGDMAGRAAFLRDMFPFALRGGRILASTPLPFYQDLLCSLGFVEVEGATHFDYGPDSPSPTYVLDLRGPHLTTQLARLAAGGVPAQPAEAPDDTLGAFTPRERDVIRGVLDGLSNAEIADRLCVTEGTVKKNLCRIFDKVGVSSRTQLVKKLGDKESRTTRN